MFMNNHLSYSINLDTEYSFIFFVSDKTEVKTMEGHKIKTKSKFKVRHQKHKLFRANEPLLSVLMWGVNFTVSCFCLDLKLKNHGRI